MRRLLALTLLIAGCASSGGSCPDGYPLDCGAECCKDGAAYFCEGAKLCYSGQPPASACTKIDACVGTGGPCAYWSCGTSSQCASVMGGSQGIQCTFASGQTCQDWCQTYIPGNCTCH